MHNEKVEEEYCSLVGKKKIIIIIVNALLGGCSSASVILFLFLCYPAIAGILVCSVLPMPRERQARDQMKEEPRTEYNGGLMEFSVVQGGE